MNGLDYLECDFFSIEKHSDGKFVHVHGYAYQSDSEANGKPYRGVEYRYFYIPITAFPDNYLDLYEACTMLCSQSILDLSEKECENYLRNYYGESILSSGGDYGKQPEHLEYNDITPDTPVGFYVTH